MGSDTCGSIGAQEQEAAGIGRCPNEYRLGFSNLALKTHVVACVKEAVSIISGKGTPEHVEVQASNKQLNGT